MGKNGYGTNSYHKNILPLSKWLIGKLAGRYSKVYFSQATSIQDLTTDLGLVTRSSPIETVAF